MSGAQEWSISTLNKLANAFGFIARSTTNQVTIFLVVNIVLCSIDQPYLTEEIVQYAAKTVDRRSQLDVSSYRASCFTCKGLSNGKHAACVLNWTGVLQGSNIGPLLFVFYYLFTCIFELFFSLIGGLLKHV